MMTNGEFKFDQKYLRRTKMRTTFLILTISIFFCEFIFAQGGGYALNFDGSDDIVICGTDSSLDLQEALTIEVWIKAGLPQTRAYSRIVDKYRYNTHQGFNLVRYPELNSTMLDFFSTEDTKHTYGGVTPTFDENWHYVAATFDGDYIKIYIDGRQENRVQLSQHRTIQLCPDYLAIGNGFDGVLWYPFKGQIDEVRLWKTAVDSITIRDWMHKKISADHPDISNLVGYWTFNEAQGSFTIDSSDYGNHGTLTNMDTMACWVTSHIPMVGNIINDLDNIAAIWSSLDSSYSSILSLKSNDVAGDTCIIFGHDKGGVSWTSSDIPGSLNILYRIDRVWRMEVYGNSTASVIFDVSQLGISDGPSLKLLKDPLGTFSNADTIHGKYDSVNQLFIVPNQILQDGYYYTLGTEEDITVIESDQQITVLNEFDLFQNYPNPFNPKTTISYNLGANNYSPIQHVDLSIFNVLGQKVCTLVSKKQEAGKHTVPWDASGFESGVYFCRLQVGQYNDVQKMILLK